MVKVDPPDRPCWQPKRYRRGAYARGLDILNGGYNFLDLTPRGRDETGLPHTMSWVRLHDL